MPAESYYFGYYFFAPNGRFNPCGMFTAGHIFAAAICIAAVIFALYFTKNSTNHSKLLRRSAIIITILESVKISHSFIYGDFYLDAWFPLSYCGLFIFALWMAGYGKGVLKRTGEVFIAYGCAVAGLIFLICPTTSLMMYPLWHYFSVYSLFFHSMMIYVGITLLKKEKRFIKREFALYAIFVIVFSVPAYVLNTIYGSNLMNLREPFNVPIEILQILHEKLPFIYSLFVVSVFLLIPVVTAFLHKIFCFSKHS